jgi:hypothetical protein
LAVPGLKYASDSHDLPPGYIYSNVYTFSSANSRALAAGFKMQHSQRFEFAYEKAQLLKILEADWNARTADAWKPHPMFGKMTPNGWGKLLQIHVDYHLRQFAA